MSLSNLYSLREFVGTLNGSLRSLLSGIGVLFGLIPKTGRFSPTIYRYIHYGFVVVVLLVLGWYSSQLIPESRVPISNWFVQRYYVAIQFLLFYLFVRLLIAAVQLLLAKDVSEFQDIDQAWEAGLDALARAGYDLQWLPVFLVNGVDASTCKSFFKLIRLQWKVSGSSEDSRSSALSFYACDEAVFISMNEVGAMSLQLRESAADSQPVAAGRAPEAVDQRTLRPGQLVQAIEQTRRPEQIQQAIGQTLKPGAIAAARNAPPAGNAIARTLRPGDIAQAVASSVPAKSAARQKLSQSEFELGRRRMEHVCQLLVAERGAYCPINGLLQLIPLRWSQVAAFEPMFESAQQDMHVIHQSLHMQFPVFVVHSGLDELVGLPQFIERGIQIEKRFLDSRAGSRYPAGLPIDGQNSEWIVQQGLSWFRDWVYAEFAANLASPQNRQLYQFLCALMARQSRLAKELTTVIGDSLPIRLSGCYFAAMGAESSKQAFIHGVVERLMSEQNDVAWLPAWRHRDSRLLWMTLFTSLLCLLVLFVDIFLAWRIWERASMIASG